MHETNEQVQSPPADQNTRAEQCAAEIQRVLREHGCRIVSYIASTEPVGTNQQGVIVRTGWGVLPEAR